MSQVHRLDPLEQAAEAQGPPPVVGDPHLRAVVLEHERQTVPAGQRHAGVVGRIEALIQQTGPSDRDNGAGPPFEHQRVSQRRNVAADVVQRSGWHEVDLGPAGGDGCRPAGRDEDDLEATAAQTRSDSGGVADRPARGDSAPEIGAQVTDPSLEGGDRPPSRRPSQAPHPGRGAQERPARRQDAGAQTGQIARQESPRRQAHAPTIEIEKVPLGRSGRRPQRLQAPDPVVRVQIIGQEGQLVGRERSQTAEDPPSPETREVLAGHRQDGPARQEPRQRPFGGRPVARQEDHGRDGLRGSLRPPQHLRPRPRRGAAHVRPSPARSSDRTSG